MKAALPSLDMLLTEPVRVLEVPEHAVAGLLAEIAAREAALAAVQTALAARLTAAAAGLSHVDEALLSIDEAAERLSVSKDWLYRHHKELPFSVPIGSQVRFSSNGINRYIRQRAGRNTA